MMIPAPRREVLAISALTLVAAPALAACDSGADTALGAALSRIEATETTVTYIEFGHTEQLTELAQEQQEPWQLYESIGGGSLTDYAGQLPQMGIDLTAAEILITAGTAPQTVTLVAGGQDEQAIADGLHAEGWEGEEVLTAEMTAPLGIAMPQVRPDGESLAVGSLEADLEWVDGGGDSLRTDDDVSDLAGCLGDVVGALLTPPEQVAAGVDAEGTSVLCVLSEDAQAQAAQIEQEVSTGRSPVTGTPYSEYFSQVSTETDGDAVRAELTMAGERTPFTVINLVMNGDLPGVEAG